MKIDAYQGSQLTRLAMKLLAPTLVRASEQIQARWSEIDFDAAECRMPAERIKVRRMHIAQFSKPSDSGAPKLAGDFRPIGVPGEQAGLEPLGRSWFNRSHL